MRLLSKRFEYNYINQKAERLARNMSNLVSEYFHKSKLIVELKSPSEIGKIFSFKDKTIDKQQESLVVYQIICNDCEASYIGKSKRIISERITEHESDNKCQFALQKHIAETSHKIDLENFKIVDRASNDLKLQYKKCST